MTYVTTFSEASQSTSEVPEQLPILPIRKVVVFPFMTLPALVVRGERWVKMVEEVLLHHKVIALFHYDGPENSFDLLSLGKTGTATQILRMSRLPDGSLHLFVQGLARVQIRQLSQTEPYPLAHMEVFENAIETTVELEGLSRSALVLFTEVVDLAPYLSDDLVKALAEVPNAGMMADSIAATLGLKAKEEQRILDTLDIAERLRDVIAILNREKEILEVARKAQEDISQTQREYVLRKQLEKIRQELGEGDEQESEIAKLRQKLEEAQLPDEARTEADRELKRLANMHTASPEYSVSHTYLDWLIDLPWNISTDDNLDLARARQVLDEDHYDLDKVKQRIIEYLAVRKLQPEAKGPILCFVGPPGVGKTSVGQSIARTLSRKFVRLSLGGVRDEAEIRGHRRTYVGALPGRILQLLRQAGSNNPVFMLDEVDKLMVGFQGDPAAALLEVLDPEQNHAFLDRYLDVSFNLRQVMFICTANVSDTIPPALLDRMEVLHLPGYTEEEKLNIAHRYLMPRQLNESGLKENQLALDDTILKRLIREYTREAGVRNLERQIGSICRKMACRVAEGDPGPFTVKADDLDDLIEPGTYRSDLPLGKDEVGVSIGLAWTPVGGEILSVEAAVIPGEGKLTLTGHLGDVMKESAKAALTYARSRAASLGLPKDFYQTSDVHIHVPAGAVPKDGPSAGIAMTVALISALTERCASKQVAMTGEIALRGRVLPVGGIKEKVLAAQRVGIQTVILPKQNERDLREVSESARSQLQFIFVEHVDEVLPVVLHPAKQPTSLTA
ncbi:MAG: endopeptidase La [Synechococcus sp.]